MTARRTRLAVAGVALVAVAAGAALAANGLRAGEDRLDLLVVGDSFAEQSQEPLRALASGQGLDTRILAFGGTSICSWDEELQIHADEPPRILVLSFAGNDLHPCINEHPEEGRPPEQIAAAYRQDLEEVLELFGDTGAQVYVVLPPPVGHDHFEANAAAMRTMYREARAAHPELGLVDSANHLDPTGTGFHLTLPCEPWDGCEGTTEEVEVRQDDRIHLTPAGGERYARAVLEVVAADARR